MNQEPAISQHELRSPASVDLAGIPLSMIEDILLRTTIAEGRPSMVRVAERLHCGVGVIESVVSSLRDRRRSTGTSGCGVNGSGPNTLWLPSSIHKIGRAHV